MGVTLGINDDYWHFILAFSATVLAVAIIPVFIKNPIVCMLTYIIYYLLIFFIQFFYEWHQAMDIEVENKYKGYVNFQKNSKKDVKFFLLGIFLGTLVGIGIYVIYFKVIGNIGG